MFVKKLHILQGRLRKVIMMHMWYWFGKDLGTFLFPGYNVTTTWGILCTCLGLAALAVLYEGMKILQIKLQQMTMASLPKSASRSSENASLLSKMSQRSFRGSYFIHCTTWYRWLFQVFHWSVHTTLGYLLMLAVMTYNAYVSVAVILGAGFGYWLFGCTLMEMNMARFYERQRRIECDKECADAIINEQRRASTVSVVAEQLVTEATIEVHAPKDV